MKWNGILLILEVSCLLISICCLNCGIIFFFKLQQCLDKFECILPWELHYNYLTAQCERHKHSMCFHSGFQMFLSLLLVKSIKTLNQVKSTAVFSILYFYNDLPGTASYVKQTCTKKGFFLHMSIAAPTQITAELFNCGCWNGIFQQYC